MTDPGAPDPNTTAGHEAHRFAAEVDRWLDRHTQGAQASVPGTPAAASLDRLMALLDPMIDTADAATRRQLLINVTHARVRRARDRAAAAGDAPAIVGSLGQSPCDPASARALDDLIEARWTAGGSDSAPLRQLLGLLDTPAAAEAEAEGDRALRIERAMAAIRADTAERRARMKLDPETARALVPQRSFRLADIASIAAMLLIGIGVLWPVLVSSREQARTALCASGMHQAGVGMGLFARDHDGRMPATGLVDPSSDRRSTSPQQAWWHVGKPGASHSANLFVVVRHGYTHLAATACPGNEHAPSNIASEVLAEMHDWASRDQVSYSYQLFRGSPPRLGRHPDGIVLSDRSPAVDQALRGEAIDLRRNSGNHTHQGQNVLRQDGGVVWLASPTLPNGDNIWLPRYLEREANPRLMGTEFPSWDGDIFLGP